MKTSVMEVNDMLSVLSLDEVEDRIGEVPGVESVTVDFAGGTATVRFDETRIEIADIKPAVRQRAYEAADAPAEGEGHGDHPERGAPEPPKPGGSASAPAADAAAPKPVADKPALHVPSPGAVAAAPDGGKPKDKAPDKH